MSMWEPRSSHLYVCTGLCVWEWFCVGMGTMCFCPGRGQNDTECKRQSVPGCVACVCVCSVHICGHAPRHLSECASISVSKVCDSVLFAPLVFGLRVGMCSHW